MRSQWDTEAGRAGIELVRGRQRETTPYDTFIMLLHYSPARRWSNKTRRGRIHTVIVQDQMTKAAWDSCRASTTLETLWYDCSGHMALEIVNILLISSAEDQLKKVQLAKLEAF